MSTEPLPSTLDVRKAAMRGVGVSGVLKPLELPRFLPLLASEEGSINVELTFSSDEDGRYVVAVAIEADVQVICQRCLASMSEHLSVENTLVLIWTEEAAVHLPRHLDPYMVTEPPNNLWELVEDELILAMRQFSYHDTEDCRMKTAVFSDPALKEDAVEEKPNPFNVLEQLRLGSKNQELK
jgi:uncharacterized protein